MKQEHRESPFERLQIIVVTPRDHIVEGLNNPPQALGTIDQREITDLRRQVVTRLRRAEPLYVARGSKLGDDLCTWWVQDYVLRKLCQEEGITESNVMLRSEALRPGKKQFEFSRAVASSSVVRNFSLPFHSHWSLLYLLGLSLGVQITGEDRKKAPQPLKTDTGPLSSLDREKVIQNGLEIRDKLEGASQRLIIVAQAGSMIEKRFSDEQAMEVALAVKNNTGNARVIILSDKGFIGRRDHPGLENNSGIELVAPTRINELCAYFYASDTIIATDSYWSWLGGGSRVMRADRNGVLERNDEFVLHTIASPLRWGVPEANTIPSGALDFTGLNAKGFISFDRYYTYHRVDSTRRGIQQGDIELLKRNVLRVIQR